MRVTTTKMVLFVVIVAVVMMMMMMMIKMIKIQTKTVQTPKRKVARMMMKTTMIQRVSKRARHRA